MPDDATSIDADEIKPIPFAWLHPAFGGDPRMQVGPTERAAVPTKAAPSALQRLENILLAGERLSGTAIYRARTELGFGRIEALEQEAREKEWGMWWTISPSQALGIAEFGEDRFELLDRSTWSLAGAARGTVAFAADVILDPLTWITVGAGGLAKIGGKPVLKVAGMAVTRKGGVRVGLRGTEDIAARVAGGATREVAEREMMERMAHDPTFHAEMMAGGEQMIRFGTRARHIDIMRTARITEPIGAAWRAAPYYEKRSRAWDILNIGLGSRYYKFTQAMKKRGVIGAERPFELYHRQQEIEIARLTREFRGVIKQIPEGRVDVVRQAMEPGDIVLTPAETAIRDELKAMSDELFEAQLGAGLVKEEQYIGQYLRHQSTKELQKFFREERRTKGLGYAEADIPEYARKLWSAEHRTTEATIDELNKLFRAKGVKKAYVTDLYDITAGYARQHVQAMEFAKLEKELYKYGEPAIPRARPKYTKERIDEMVAAHVEAHQLEYPRYEPTRRLIAYPELTELAEEDITRRYLRPIEAEVSEERLAYEELIEVSRLTRETLAIEKLPTMDVPAALHPLREYIEAEKRGVFRGTYRAAKRMVSEVEEDVATYRRLYGDIEAREAWAMGRKEELHAIPISPGAPEALEVYTRARISTALHEIALLPTPRQRAAVRATGGARLRGAEELAVEEAELIRGAYVPPLFGVEAGRIRRAYPPEEILEVAEPYRRELELITKKPVFDPTKVFGEEEFYLYKMATGEQVYFPEAVATELRKPMRRYISAAGTSFRDIEEGYIWMETQLKKSLTVLWPAFFARNIQGGMFQNYLEDVGFVDYARSWDVLLRTSNYKLAREARKILSIDDMKTYDVPILGRRTAREMREMMRRQGVVGTATGHMDVPLSAMQGGEATGLVSKLPVWLQKQRDWWWNKYPETAMTGTEAMVRTPLFMHELYKGATEEVAELAVGKAHFRYGAHELTYFEAAGMKRLMPFWTWARWNIRRQSEMVVRRPGKYATLFKAQERVVSEEERARMPDWMREKLGFTVGEDVFVGVDLPIGEMPGLYGIGDIGFGISPMIKYPMGAIMRRDVLTGRPVEGLERNIEFMYESLLPRGTYATKEVRKTIAGERALSWTVAHQLGGVGVYEMGAGGEEAAYWSKIGKKPAWYPGEQEEYETYQREWGWQPRLTEEGQFALRSQLGETDIFGTPCNGQCVTKHIVPVELGGSNVLSNMALVHRSNLHRFEEYMQPMAIERVRSPTTLPVISDEDRYRFGVMFDDKMNDTMMSIT